MIGQARGQTVGLQLDVEFVAEDFRRDLAESHPVTYGERCRRPPPCHQLGSLGLRLGSSKNGWPHTAIRDSSFSGQSQLSQARGPIKLKFYGLSPRLPDHVAEPGAGRPTPAATNSTSS
jgi:hypothetical protein